MFTVPINDEQRQYAWDLVSSTNFGQRATRSDIGMDSNGNKGQQYTGILGQTVLADLLNLPRPVKTSEFDGGVDFIIRGFCVDLKTMARDFDVSPRWANNLWQSQCDDKRSRTEVYAFASINRKKRTFTFCGLFPRQWVSAAYGVKYYPAGTMRDLRKNGEVVQQFPLKAGMYEISMDRLISVALPGEIPDKIEHIFL